MTDGGTFINVPVELSESVRLEVYVGSGSPGCVEAPGGVLYLGPTTRRYLLLLFGEAEHEGVRDLPIGRLLSLFVSVALLRRGDGAPKNKRVLGRNTLEIGDAETEILSDDFARSVNEPVGKHERGSGGIKVAVGEHQQEFETVVQRLDTMGNALGEPRGAIYHQPRIFRLAGAHVKTSGSVPLVGPLISLI